MEEGDGGEEMPRESRETGGIVEDRCKSVRGVKKRLEWDEAKKGQRG